MMKSFVLFLSVFLGVTSYAQQAEALVKLVTLNDRFTYDIRYASTNNFLEEAFYDCAACYLRPEVANALKEANHYFCEKGYRIVLFDCYRPVSEKKKLWEVYDDGGHGAAVGGIPQPTICSQPVYFRIGTQSRSSSRYQS